jgi:hypothetical protein
MSEKPTAGAREDFEQLFEKTRDSLSAYLVNRSMQSWPPISSQRPF